MKTLPVGNNPPFKAWSIQFPPDKYDRASIELVFLQIGIQFKGEQPDHVVSKVQSSLANALGPAIWERSTHVDPSGYCNIVFLCYWIDKSRYREWLAHDQVRSWHGADAGQGYGIWLETLTTRPDYFEATNGSHARVGFANFFGFEVTPFRGYFGASRDKIDAAEDNGCSSSLKVPLEHQTSDSFGKHLSVTPPENVCFIRFGMEWDNCRDEEREWYLHKVHPVMRRGMEYLSENPIEANCISVRLTDIVTPTGAPTRRATGLAYFTDMSQLERWSWHHPTHIAILKSAIKMSERFNQELSMSIWHEIHILPKDALQLEYRNCHSKTGFLNFFPASTVC